MNAELEGIAVVLLAAGSSVRMGRPKQLLPYGGRSLLRHAAEQAAGSGCRPVLVVLGAELARMAQELEGLDVQVVPNPDWAEGMASSVRAGIRALGLTPQAAVLTICDQPLVSATLIRRLAEEHLRSGRRIVACEYAGTLGVPALFNRELFPQLEALEGDRGARRILAQHSAEAARVPFLEGAIDVDTPEDYERLTRNGDPSR